MDTSGYETSSGDIRDMIDMYLTSFRRHQAGDLFSPLDTANIADDRLACLTSPMVRSSEVSSAFGRQDSSFFVEESHYGTPIVTSWPNEPQIEMVRYETPASINYTLPLTHI
jgi:hypothetical protein